MARMKREQNIIRDISDAAAAIRGSADGLVEFIIVLNIRYGGAVLCAFVVDVYLQKKVHQRYYCR